MNSKINYILLLLILINVIIYIIVDGYKNPLFSIFPVGVKKLNSEAFYYTYFNIKTYNTTSLIFYFILSFFILKSKILKNKVELINNRIAAFLSPKSMLNQSGVNELNTFENKLLSVGFVHINIAHAMIIELVVAIISSIVFLKSKNIELNILIGFLIALISIFIILYIIYCFLKIGYILTKINSKE